MKKSVQLFALMGAIGLAVGYFGADAIARTTGYLYGDALVIGYPGTTVASISTAGALAVTGFTNTGALVNTGNLTNSGGQVVFQSVSSTTLATLTPVADGAVVNCSTYNSLCVSTGTGVGAWVFVSTQGFAGSDIPCDQ